MLNSDYPFHIVNVKSRIYWSCYIADNFVSLVLGRPKTLKLSDTNMPVSEITKFNYRTLFDKRANQNISHTEMVFKVFGIENISDVDFEPQSQKLYFKDHTNE